MTEPNPPPLFPRPLLFFLPFFIIGLTLGPSLVRVADWLWPAAALSACFSALLYLRGRGRLPAVLTLGLAFGLIGAAASASVFTPPAGPSHVYNLRDRPNLVVGGRVAEPVRVVRGRTRIIIEAEEALDYGSEPWAASGRIYLTVLGEGPRLAAGDRVRFPAALREISNFENPGRFDYKGLMAGRGLWVSAFVKSPRLVARIDEPGQSLSPRYFLDRLRNRAARFLDRSLGQPARGLIKALVLGIQDDIEPELREAFRGLGLAHLLAISGLHVGLVALVAYGLFLKLMLLRANWTLRFNLRRVAVLPALGLVLFYAGLAGGRPSTVRAAIMIGVFLLAGLIERRRDLLTALVAAAWVILIVQPGAVFTASFQLSFAAAGALIIIAPRFPASPFTVPHSPGEGPGPKPLLSRAWGLAVISIAAFMGTAPIVAAHFHRLPLLSLPANMIFTPLVSLGIVPPGLAALALAPVFPWAAQAVLWLIERFLWVVLAPLETLAALPGLDLMVPGPGPCFLIAYYLLIAALFLVRPWKKKALALAAVLAAFSLTLIVPLMAAPDRPQLKVTMLDVGQGNAAYVSLPDGTRMMIDGGGFSNSEFDTGENIVAPYLLDQGIMSLDIIALSHPQADHVGGLPYLAKAFGPKEIWYNRAPSRNLRYQELIALARDQGLARPSLAELHRPRRFGPAQVQALAPAPGFLAAQTRREIRRGQNNNSLVLKIVLGKVGFLFPGDLETEGEARILERHKDRLQADVLLACHHGSSTSLTPAFLAAVRPKIVIFSMGRGNRFGFPSPQILARAGKIGARIYRTDRHGAIICSTNGKTLEVKTFR